jgi:hypothetical protein
MRLYGKCGKDDPCHDRRHCNPWRGSRTRENRNAFEKERQGWGERFAKRATPAPVRRPR